MLKRKSSPAPGQQPLKRPKLRGSPRVDSDMPGDPHDVVIDVLMTISPREADQPEANQVRRESPYLATSEQQHQSSSSAVYDVTGEQGQSLCDSPYIPTGCATQEQDIPLPPYGNDLKTSVSEVRALAAALRSENVALERKLDANLEAVAAMLLRISSIENLVVRSSEGTLEPGPARVGGSEDFKFLVMSTANKLLYPRTTPLSPLGLDVPSIPEVLDFMEGRNIGPTIAHFRIDPASKPNSPWNLQACQVFGDIFCAKNHQGIEGKTAIDVTLEFYLMMPGFIAQHALTSGFASPQSFERFQESLRRHVRRHRLAELRLRVVNEVHELRGFLPVVQQLVEEDGMSSDEQGADDVRDLRSSRPFWRHPSITEWLHNIDSVGANLETPRNAAQNGYRRRKSSEVDKESRVVKGLPLNFYDWSYLNNLERPQYLALDPKPVLSLEFSESIQRILCGSNT